MIWLVLFGLIHAHLILWMGDILYLYGICGMLVYLLRNVNPKYLVLGVPLVAVFDFGVNTAFYQYIRAQRIAYSEAKAAKDEGKTLTEEQNKALEAGASREVHHPQSRGRQGKHPQDEGGLPRGGQCAAPGVQDGDDVPADHRLGLTGAHAAGTRPLSMGLPVGAVVEPGILE